MYVDSKKKINSERERNSDYQGLGLGRAELFKGTFLQLSGKSWRSNIQYGDYRQQNCVINI